MSVFSSFSSAYAVEEMTDKEIIDAVEAEEKKVSESFYYINDIEILGANIIKPEYILSKISLLLEAGS